jgi:hypothetical protein
MKTAEQIKRESDEFWQFIGQQLLWRIPYFVFAIILIYKLVEYALS